MTNLWRGVRNVLAWWGAAAALHVTLVAFRGPGFVPTFTDNESLSILMFLMGLMGLVLSSCLVSDGRTDER